MVTSDQKEKQLVIIDVCISDAGGEQHIKPSGGQSTQIKYLSKSTDTVRINKYYSSKSKSTAFLNFTRVKVQKYSIFYVLK